MINKIISTFQDGVTAIINGIEATEIKSESLQQISFTIPGLFCIMGINKIGSMNDYFDIRWRVFLSSLSTGNDIRIFLKNNFNQPETCYSIFEYQSDSILVLTDSYRFLSSWGYEEIIDIMKIRFGGAFSYPLTPPNMQGLSEEKVISILSNNNLKELLGH